MKKLIALLLFCSPLHATSFSYSDSSCALFGMAPDGVITCLSKIGPPPPPVSPPSANLCQQYGITSNTLLTRAGNGSKTMGISATQGYSFSFTTGAAGSGGQLRTNYSNVPTQYVSVSKSACDYAASLEPLCAKQAGTPLIYYKVGGSSSYQCILEANTTYYFNVRDASRDATTKAFTNTCSGNCSFMMF